MIKTMIMLYDDSSLLQYVNSVTVVLSKEKRDMITDHRERKKDRKRYKESNGYSFGRFFVLGVKIRLSVKYWNLKN